VDLHKSFFQACAVQVDGERVWEGRFPRTPAGLAAFVARDIGRAPLAVEAMGPTWAFVDAVQARVAQVCVVDPRKTKLKAGYAAKTDQLDARRLADAVRRDSVVRVYIPPPAIRHLRELCRGRHHLVRVRARLMQTITSRRLRPDGGDPPVTRLASPRGIAWLQTRELPGAAGESLQRLTRALRAVDAEARLADAAVRARAAEDPLAMALTQVKGVGPVLALTLRAEIGTVTRFQRWPQLASYAGLVTRVDASAGRVRHGRITREGSPWIRWALGEAAIPAMTRRAAIGRWARRLAGRISICPARVALARRLCRAIVRVWRTVE
jgi:transposase